MTLDLSENWRLPRWLNRLLILRKFLFLIFLMTTHILHEKTKKKRKRKIIQIQWSECSGSAVSPQCQWLTRIRTTFLLCTAPWVSNDVVPNEDQSTYDCTINPLPTATLSFKFIIVSLSELHLSRWTVQIAPRNHKVVVTDYDFHDRVGLRLSNVCPYFCSIFHTIYT